ncbi:response regulator [Nakamurella deserti]|uniref:response regulator n=1 Tax=Nakamurella deserti TaxID=2164074 RepID=UPI000DBE9E91|nr:response regulator [Nakamurella deserti]
MTGAAPRPGVGEIAVLVVEDEPLTAEAHAEFVGRVPGFRVTGTVNNAQAAMAFLKQHRVDMVLLDFNLPDAHGLEICRALRMARADVDVIAVTANRDLPSVRAAVSLGVVQYILKPFTFRSLQDKLVQYREFRQQLRDGASISGQLDIDRALATLRRGGGESLPSGLTEATLQDVSRVLQEQRAAAADTGLSALEVATRSNLSRVTARRYLEHLVDSGPVQRHQRHGRSGRPEIEYRWTAS